MENKDITAKWARETSQKVLSEKVNRQIDTCLEAIKESVKSNELSVDITMCAEPLTIKELQNRGFEVNKHTGFDQRDPDYIRIKW